MTLSWFSKNQTYLALSLIEVEYMVVNNGSYEAIWIYKLLVGLLIRSWIPWSFTVILRVASNFENLVFLIGPGKERSYITSYEVGFKF